MSDIGLSVQISPVVLLVEDSDSDAEIFIRIFCKNGFRGIIARASDGDEALDFICQRGEFVDAKPPDIVILDLNIPRVDGLGILQHIHKSQDPNVNTIPVIVLSATVREEDIAASMRLGAAAFFSKPLQLDKLKWLIDHIKTIEFPRLGINIEKRLSHDNEQAR